MKIPKYRHHKSSDQALVEWKGQRVYLGRYGTQESKELYKAFLDRNVLPHLIVPATVDCSVDTRVRVGDLLRAYLRAMQKRYRTRPDKYNRCAVVASLIIDQCGEMLVDDVGPLRMKKARQALIDRRRPDGQPLTRGYINETFNRLRDVFRWGVEHELVKPDTLTALMAIKPLQDGDSDARDSKMITPAPLRHIVAVIRSVHPTIATMIRVQLRTGMRPQNLFAMNLDQIDRSKAVWVYRPTRHKSKHRGRVLAIPLGPKVQRLLAPYLNRSVDAPFFSPREVVDEQNAAKRAARTSKRQPSQAARRKKRAPLRTAGATYNKDSYRRLIARACEKLEVPHWHPNQLRHNFATFVRRHYGLEASQVLLGHATADVTQVYAETNLGRAVEIAAKIG